MEHRRMENLAPAGNPEALERAIAAGADAVYLGYSVFSARAGAGNFDETALREAIRLAHLHHVRVYVAVNTLIKDSELDEALSVLRLLADLRADAVLVQDLGLAALCRECLPGLPVHASTQMAIHNAVGVRFCAVHGMKRVVLARECSLSEIALCAKEDAEIEVFGHGAQCVAVSGECLFSSMVGGRSGNRGRCAQPCRLNYTYRGQTGAWLSPRDVCLRDRLDALCGAGAVSVKLEGRLKRPEYVSVVTSSYRSGLDQLAEGCFRSAGTGEAEGLRQIFNRGSFMRGYAFGAEDADVISPGRVDHSGVSIGTITGLRPGLAQVLLTRSLHNGDQLRITAASGDAELLYAGRETPAGETAIVRLRAGIRASVGDEVIRLADSAQLAAARAIPLPQIPVDMHLAAIPGEALRLTVSDGSVTCTCEGEPVQAASQRPMTVEDARRSLAQTGGTAFTMRELTLDGDHAFVPVSAMKNLRREALSRLGDARADAFARPVSTARDPAPLSLEASSLPDTLIFRVPAQIRDVSSGTRLIWRPEDYRPNALEESLSALPAGVWLQLPTVCENSTLEALHGFVHMHRDRLGGVLLDNAGQLGMTWDLPYAAGPGIPVTNRRTLSFLLDEGCRFAVASPELNARELEILCAGRPPLLLPAYGRTRLMLLHHCPARTFLGLSRGHASCRMCDQHTPDSLSANPFLTDRMGKRLPLFRVRLPEGCLVELYNPLPTRYPAAASRLGCALLTVLTDEASPAHLPQETTGGHWARGVE